MQLKRLSKQDIAGAAELQRIPCALQALNTDALAMVVCRWQEMVRPASRSSVNKFWMLSGNRPAHPQSQKFSTFYGLYRQAVAL